jgi:hypothetical protein
MGNKHSIKKPRDEWDEIYDEIKGSPDYKKEMVIRLKERAARHDEVIKRINKRAQDRQYCTYTEMDLETFKFIEPEFYGVLVGRIRHDVLEYHSNLISENTKTREEINVLSMAFAKKLQTPLDGNARI